MKNFKIYDFAQKTVLCYLRGWILLFEIDLWIILTTINPEYCAFCSDMPSTLVLANSCRSTYILGIFYTRGEITKACCLFANWIKVLENWLSRNKNTASHVCILYPKRKNAFDCYIIYSSYQKIRWINFFFRNF